MIAPDDPVKQDDGQEEDGHPHFSLRQFLQQSLVQFTYPLSALPSAVLCSPGFVLNLIGIGSPFRPMALIPTLFFTLFSLCPFVVFTAYALSQADPSPWVSASVRSDALHVAIAFLSQRLTVCIKYAFIPRAAYARRLRQWASTKELQAEQLITGWFRLDPRTIAREVGVAVAHYHPGSEQQTIGMPPPCLARLHSVLRCSQARAALEAGLQAAGGALPVPALASAILLQAVSQESAYTSALQGLLFGVAGLGTFTTTIIRAAAGTPLLGSTAQECTVIIGHWVANVVVMGVTFTFLAIGAIDHRRRAASHRLLGELCKPGAQSCAAVAAEGAGSEGSAERPAGGAAAAAAAHRPAALSLHSTASVTAFLSTRRLLRAFGAAYHDRLVLVISCSLIVFSALAVYCLATLAALSASPGGSASASLMVSSFVLLHVLALPAALCCALGLHEAQLVNEQLRRHVALLVHARVELRLAAGEGGALDARLLGLLEDVERHLAEEQLAEPVCILGIPASDALTKGFVGAWLSLEGSALAVFFLWATGARQGAGS